MDSDTMVAVLEAEGLVAAHVTIHDHGDIEVEFVVEGPGEWATLQWDKEAGTMACFFSSLDNELTEVKRGDGDPVAALNEFLTKIW